MMGGLMSYFRGLFGNREMRILILGLDGAGKTTLLYRLQVCLSSHMVCHKNTCSFLNNVCGVIKLVNTKRLFFIIQVGEVVTTIPTIGFNVEQVTYKNLKFQVWDLGGQTSIR